MYVGTITRVNKIGINRQLKVIQNFGNNMMTTSRLKYFFILKYVDYLKQLCGLHLSFVYFYTENVVLEIKMFTVFLISYINITLTCTTFHFKC